MDGGQGGKKGEDKAAENADREAANAHAREQAREQRRQDKLKPAPRAQQWCDKVQTCIGQCGDIMAQCKDASTALPPSFAAQCNVTFASWIKTLEDSRKKITDWKAAGTEIDEAEVAQCEAPIERFKRDKKGYDMQVKFYRKGH